MYNFKIFLQRTHFWGYIKSGRWHGAVGMLNRKEVDVCVSGLRWEDECYGVFEPTTNSYALHLKFIFRHPKSNNTNIFTSPFDKKVWITIALICFTCSYILTQIFAAENHRKVRKFIGERSTNEDSWSNSLLIVFGILFQQGFEGDPILISSRIVTLTVLVFSVLIFQFYSSFIVGSLLTEAPKSIKTIQQLLHSQLEFGVDDVPYILDKFQHASEKSTVQLYEHIMKTKDKSIMKTDEGLNLIKRGGFAFNTGILDNII